jgi:hypothetical protein
MDILFGPQIIKSYKRLSYKEWYALAEFVDNSTDAYLNNKVLLDSILKDDNLTVKISYSSDQDEICIEDNSIGMNKDELEDAMTIGLEPKESSGRSRYGLGMKTAACWLGNYWTIQTSKLGDDIEHFVEIDVNKIAESNQDNQDLINYKSKKVDKQSHYTIIRITELNRKFANRTRGHIKNYLTTIYRNDFERLGLKLYWEDKLLMWDRKKMIDDKLHKNRDGTLKKKNILFTVGDGNEEKTVRGWVGVFEKGGRKKAGFSISQHGRIIRGWPDAYKPELIFGDNRNDLVNQRLVGELELDEFDVSHTKDQILFLNDEQEELEALLEEQCYEYITFAKEYRKYHDDERALEVNEGNSALNEFEQELNSAILNDKINNEFIPDKSLIDTTKRNIIGTVMQRMPASLKAKINSLEVLIYLDSNLSPNDPYVLIESTQNRNRVIIVINTAHPHWLYLNGSNAALNFIRHCTYDGIAEWKANFIVRRLENSTIKYIKDDLLRVAFEIEGLD